MTLTDPRVCVSEYLNASIQTCPKEGKEKKREEKGVKSLREKTKGGPDGIEHISPDRRSPDH